MNCPYCGGKLGLKVEVTRHYSLESRVQTIGSDGKENLPTFVLGPYRENESKWLYPSLECMVCNRKFYEAGARAEMSDDKTMIILPNFSLSKLQLNDVWSGYYYGNPKPKTDEKFVLKERPRNGDNDTTG